MLTRLMVAVGIMGSIGASDGVWADLSRERDSGAVASARGQAAEPDPPATEPVRIQAEDPTEPTIEPTPTSTPVFYRADLGTIFPPTRVVATETPTALPTTEPTDEPANANPAESDTVPVRVRAVEPTEEPTARTESTGRRRPTEAPDLPRPTRDLPVIPNRDGDGGDDDFFLYVAAGALIMLATGAGIVFGTRRSSR